MQPTSNISILRIQKDRVEKTTDTVIEEAIYTLHANGKDMATLLCSPAHVRELAAGFLGSMGFISRRDELLELNVNHAGGIIRVRTGVPRTSLLQAPLTVQAADMPPVEGDVKATARQLLALSRELEERGELFRRTGGTHGAALCRPGGITCSFEDVGRHNAVDKVFGYCLLNEIPRHDKLLALTGRVSAEILLKAARLGVPFVVSRSAPTRLALELAEHLRVTVVGFARGERLNVYTHPQRVRG